MFCILALICPFGSMQQVMEDHRYVVIHRTYDEDGNPHDVVMSSGEE